MLKSLFWIGATGIALVAGIALHHGEDIERAGQEIAANVERLEDLEGVGQHFEREFDEAEVAIGGGADREASYEEAMASALVSSGLFTLDNIDDISRGDGVRRLQAKDGVRIDIVDVIDQARSKLEEAEAAGNLPESRGIDGDNINDVLGMLEDLEALESDIRVSVQ